MSFETIVQSTNSGVSNARSYLDNKANTILRPKENWGIEGFIFDVPSKESLNITYDITDHFTESNSFLNDHKVKKPIIITLTGFIGELVFRSPAGVEGAVQEISNRLEAVEAYTGDLTPGAVQEAQRVVQRAQAAISAINQTLDKAQNIIGFFDGDGPEETAQQKAYKDISALGDTIKLEVQTPWDFFNDMTIQSISATQDKETNQITDFSVTLKQIRVSDTETVDFDKDQFPVREKVQSAPAEDQGNIRGQDELISLPFKIFGRK